MLGSSAGWEARAWLAWGALDVERAVVEYVRRPTCWAEIPEREREVLRAVDRERERARRSGRFWLRVGRPRSVVGSRP